MSLETKGAKVDVFLNGQGPEDAPPFRRLGNAGFDDGMGRLSMNGFAVETNAPVGGFHQSAHGQECGGFARPVGAQNGDYFTLGNGQVDAVEHFYIIVFHMKVFDFPGTASHQSFSTPR